MFGGLICLYIFNEMIKEASRMTVMSSLSAVHSTMLQAWRAMGVWLVALGVRYLVDRGISFGEAWTVYSPLQLLGFLFILAGQSVYGAMVELPGLHYPSEPQAQEQQAQEQQAPEPEDEEPLIAAPHSLSAATPTLLTFQCRATPPAGKGTEVKPPACVVP